MPLSKRQKDRLRVMNQHLYPATLRYREDTSAFFLSYRRAGRDLRKTLGKDLEVAYDRSLVIRKGLDDLPVVTDREVTLQHWYEQYAMQRFDGLSPKTVDGYRYSFTCIPDDLKTKPIHKINAEVAKSAIDEIEKPGARKNAGIFLSILLNAAVKEGVISKNPYKPKFETRKRVVPVLSTSNPIKLCEHASDTARPGITLAAFCGLRYGEIMAIRCKHIDCKEGLLYVEDARVKIYGDNGVDQLKTTKTDEPRVLPLPDVAQKILEPYLETMKPDDMLYPVWRQDLDKRLEVAARRAGLPKVTMHGLRHIVGSRMMMTDGVAAAQATLGHKDVSTTVDTYGHLTAVYLKNKSDLINLAPDILEKAYQLSEELSNHPEEKVQELASISRQFWHVLARQRETGTQQIR